MYKPIKSPDDLQDLLSRKEFAIFSQRENKFRDIDETPDILTGKFLKVQSYQQFVRNFMNPNTQYSRLHLMHGTGCHGVGVKVMVFDPTAREESPTFQKFTARPIESIRVGDLLCGPDGSPRRVCGLACGIGQIYNVSYDIREGRASFTANAEHILCLGKARRAISVADYLRLDPDDPLSLMEMSNVKLSTPTIIITPAYYGFYYGVTIEGDGLYLLEDGTITHNTGKCLGRDTPVLMFGGGIKPVQDVSPGDMLIGEYGDPRHVLSLGCGCGDLCKIETENGLSFVCNLEHILTIIYGHKTHDITINDFLCLPSKVRERARMKLSRIDYSLDSSETVFRKVEQIGENRALKADAEQSPESPLAFPLELSGPQESKITRGVPFLPTIPRHKITCHDAYFAGYSCKNIARYLYTPRDIRLNLLAGIIDRRGEFTGDTYKILAGPALANEVLFCGASLGFMVWNFPPYVHISGKLTKKLPLMIGQPRPTPEHSREISFTVSPAGWGQFYGFVLDGDGRFLLGNTICTHNTIAACSIATEFIRQYREYYTSLMPAHTLKLADKVLLDEKSPTVYILGFGGAKKAFVDELLTRPDFGMITYDEYITLGQLLAKNYDEYHEYYADLRRRLSDKFRGGFYKFYGYDEFVNRLFLLSGQKASVTQIEEYVMKHADPKKTVKNLVDEFIASPASGFRINDRFLRKTRNSLIIADEIHNTYNAAYKNNRGIAIQYVLDCGFNTRFLSLSATPLNNSPAEIAEFINYFITEPLPSGQLSITRADLFSAPRIFKPGALELIGNVAFGKISFLQDANLKYFPWVIYEGEPITLSVATADFPAGQVIPYLKFHSCDMSEFHENTYKSYIANAETLTKASEGKDAPIIEQKSASTLPDSSQKTNLPAPEKPANVPGVDDEEGDDELEDATESRGISSDGYALFDIAFPNPESNALGLYRGSTIRNKYAHAAPEWLSGTGVSPKKSAGISIWTGKFLRRENLTIYSTKYAHMVDKLIEIMREARGDARRGSKVMIYHDRVRTSGVLLIQEILLMNGFLDEFSDPSENTRCAICGVESREHPTFSKADEKETKSQTTTNLSNSGLMTHPFYPARFIMAHGEIGKQALGASLAKYNSPGNSGGTSYMVLIGSRLIRESFNFREIRHLMIMAAPINISTLLQVFGRCIRKGSHAQLPPDLREVHVHIFASTSRAFVAPEIVRYAAKLGNYLVIQRVERELSRAAIDAATHEEINMPPDLKKVYFPTPDQKDPLPRLGSLYYTPRVPLPRYNEYKTATFRAFEYDKEEIRQITFILKRLFIRRPAWTFDQLVNSVLEPPTQMETNPRLFDRRNISIAISGLLMEDVAPKNIKAESDRSRIISSLLDFSDNSVYIAGVQHRIRKIGKNYVALPNMTTIKRPLSSRQELTIAGTHSRETAVIKEFAGVKDQVFVDVDCFIQPQIRYSSAPGSPLGSGPESTSSSFTSLGAGDLTINLEQHIRTRPTGDIYQMHRRKFLRAKDNMFINYPIEFQIEFIEEAIVATLVGQPIPEHTHILQILTSLDAAITAGEIKKYKEVSKSFRELDYPPDTILGFTSTNSVRLYDPAPPSRWMDINKSALNRHTYFRENDLYVGIIEPFGKRMRFKIRPPFRQLADARELERGMVCETKKKEELIEIANKLRVEKEEFPDLAKIRDICTFILRQLVLREIDNRARNTNIKYMYFWWDSTAFPKT